MRKKWKRASFRWLVLMLTGMGLLLALAAGGLAWLFYSAAQRQTALFCENILKSSAHGEEVITEATKDVFDSISLDASMLELLNANEIKPKKLLEGLRQLQIYRETNYFIDSIYIYNPRIGQIYVSSLNATEAVWTLEDFYDREAVRLFADYTDYRNMQPVTRELNVSYPAIDTVHLLTYMRYNTLSPPGKSSVVMVNVRMEALFEKIYTPLEEMDTSLLLIDEQGRLRYSSAAETQHAKELAAKVVSRSGRQGTFVEDGAGAGTIVCYRPAFGGYWTLIFTANQNQMFNLLETSTFSIWVLVFTLLFALLCFGCAVLMRRLAQTQRDNQARLEAAEKKQREAAEETHRRAVLRFLHGGDGRYIHQLKIADIALPPQKRVRLAVLVLDRYTSQVARQYAGPACMALKYGICNIATEMLDGVCFTAYEDDARCIAVLEARPEAELTGDLSTFQEKVSNVLDVSLSAFLSGEVCCDQLPIAYDGLCGALPYQKLFGPNSTITAEMLARRELQEYTLHEEHLRRISKEILRMDTAQALVHVDELLEQMSQSSYRSFQRCLLQLVTALDKALETLQRNNQLEETLYTDVLIYNLGSLESMEDIHSAIENMLHQTEEAMTQKNSDRLQQLLENIRNTVTQGYADRDFSVNTIADATNLSPAYVGRLFKRSTGITLVEYILEVRMDAARTLLTNTDLSVTEIVPRVGFGDAPYFYKVFKKTNGCTPAQYRANQRGLGKVGANH